MEREVLERWLQEGLSLEQIARRVGRHPSTVGYWVAKHGLEAAHRKQHLPRGALDRDVLAGLVEEGFSTREIARRVDRSQATVCHWLREYGLVTKRSRRIERHGMAGDRVAGICPQHGETLFAKRSDGALRCLRCRSEAVARRRRRVKAVLVREAGGRCALCGYDRHPGALQFHHRTPEAKRFAISDRGVTRSLDRARAEASKCVLLCSNCHAEIEAGVATLTDVEPPSDSSVAHDPG